ncbi:MAG: hypothetical protein R2795_27595, partial [Saprospiraceae bacterium]
CLKILRTDFSFADRRKLLGVQRFEVVAKASKLILAACLGSAEELNEVFMLTPRSKPRSRREATT